MALSVDAFINASLSFGTPVEVPGAVRNLEDLLQDLDAHSCTPGDDRIYTGDERIYMESPFQASRRDE